MADIIPKHGRDVRYFALLRKINQWAIDESWARGRDVTFAEVFCRWLLYVDADGPRLANEYRQFY